MPLSLLCSLKLLSTVQLLLLLHLHFSSKLTGPAAAGAAESPPLLKAVAVLTEHKGVKVLTEHKGINGGGAH